VLLATTYYRIPPFFSVWRHVKVLQLSILLPSMEEEEDTDSSELLATTPGTPFAVPVSSGRSPVSSSERKRTSAEHVRVYARCRPASASKDGGDSAVRVEETSSQVRDISPLTPPRCVSSRSRHPPRCSRCLLSTASGPLASASTVSSHLIRRVLLVLSFNRCELSSWHFQNTAQVYEELAAPLLLDVLEGFEACILAYGQTGSGKTHSLFADESAEMQSCGMFPHVAADLFTAVQSDFRHIYSVEGACPSEYRK
jgi:Kinesin motor domain